MSGGLIRLEMDAQYPACRVRSKREVSMPANQTGDRDEEEDRVHCSERMAPKHMSNRLHHLWSCFFGALASLLKLLWKGTLVPVAGPNMRWVLLPCC